MSTRPSVPNEVRRELRQESGFGCCNCGHPFVQFHHIVPWSEDQHFRPEDMMTLCSHCHHLCTVGAITESEQRQMKRRPKNIIDDNARGLLYVNSRRLEVHLGGGIAINTPVLLMIENTFVLQAKLSEECGRVLISALIHDSRGWVVGRIIDNEWEIPPSGVWDIEAYPRTATVREKARDISFSVDTRQDQVKLRGKWFYRGDPVQFSENEMRFGTNKLVGFHVEDCPIFMGLG